MASFPVTQSHCQPYSQSPSLVASLIPSHQSHCQPHSQSPSLIASLIPSHQSHCQPHSQSPSLIPRPPLRFPLKKPTFRLASLKLESDENLISEVLVQFLWYWSTSGITIVFNILHNTGCDTYVRTYQGYSISSTGVVWVCVCMCVSGGAKWNFKRLPFLAQIFLCPLNIFLKRLAFITGSTCHEGKHPNKPRHFTPPPPFPLPSSPVLYYSPRFPKPGMVISTQVLL